MAHPDDTTPAARASLREKPRAAARRRELPPYVFWRDGRPRFIPGPRERALGYKGEDLRHGNGDWFTFEQTASWGRDRNAEIERARGTGRRPATPRSPRGRTVGDLLDDWIDSGDFAEIDSEATRRGYVNMARAVKFTPHSAGRPDRERDREPFSLAPVGAIGRRQVKKFIMAMKLARGPHMALGMKAALSAAFTWGMDDDKWSLNGNPCFKLNLKRPRKPAPVIWSVPDYLPACAFGDHPVIAGETPAAPVMVDAIMLAVWSGQRPEDVIYFEGGALVDVLDPVSGSAVQALRFVQSKTGKVMSVPPSRFLAARLAAIAARHAAEGYAGTRLIAERRPSRKERGRDRSLTMHDYSADTFRHHFAQFVEAVAAGRPELSLPACPSISGKRLKHLRKAHITWSKAAGNDLAGIAAVSGHDLQSLNVIGQHYLFLGESEAATAIARLEAWLAPQLALPAPKEERA